MANASTASRVYLSVIGLALALIGSVFFSLMWRSYQRAREVGEWPVVPCVILQSEAEERQIDPNGPVESRFAVLYGYEWNGKPFESELLTIRGSGWSSKEDKVRALMERYPEGSVQECHVHPDQPAIAVLHAESKGPGYSLWFPALFIVGGFGIVAGAWRR